MAMITGDDLKKLRNTLLDPQQQLQAAKDEAGLWQKNYSGSVGWEWLTPEQQAAQLAQMRGNPAAQTPAAVAPATPNTASSSLMDTALQQARANIVSGGPQNFLITSAGKTVGIPGGGSAMGSSLLPQSAPTPVYKSSGINTSGVSAPSVSPASSPASASGSSGRLMRTGDIGGARGQAGGTKREGGITGAQRFEAQNAEDMMRLAYGLQSQQTASGQMFSASEAAKERAQQMAVLEREAQLAELAKESGYGRAQSFLAPILEMLTGSLGTGDAGGGDTDLEAQLAQALAKERQTALSELGSELARRGMFKVGAKGEGVGTEATMRLLEGIIPQQAREQIELRKSEKERKSKEQMMLQYALAELYGNFGKAFL